MIKQEQNPCWLVVCDGCEEGIDDSEGFEPHFPTLESAVAHAQACEWKVALDGSVTCPSCAAAENEDGDEPPAPGGGGLVPGPAAA